MTRLLTAIACGLALAVTALSGVARADEANRKTILTFNEPFEIPGRVLPAGRYQFRLVDSSETQNVVEIASADGKHVIAMLLTIPRYRSTTPGKTIVTFKQRVPGAPPAIRAWFYPGADDGEEFVYPKTRAVAIAQAANEPVKTTSDTMTEHMTAAEPATQAAAVQALQDAPVQVAQPSGEVTEVEEVFTAVPKALPQTAGVLGPELALGGVLVLLGLALRFSARTSNAD